MTDPLVTIGGPPGSGKSTAGRAVAAQRHLEFVSAGELFRAEARRRRISLAELGTLAETDETIDRGLDDEMLRRATPGRLLDGRVTGPLCRRRGIDVRYIVVTADPEVRFQRLARRDGGDVAEVERLTRAREESERRRYSKYYQIDLSQERTDLTVDSTNGSPDEVVRAILDFLSSPEGRPA
ncbi:MAG: AAA family ATPase [Thermoplasmata archaeon]|nr:AAA family ATPase [Thermoplasmata archaeon]MCI4357082.1 AAA family ATPase [Thermoplasmata archaeon]